MINLLPSKLFMTDLAYELKKGLNIIELKECVDSLTYEKKPEVKYCDKPLHGRFEGFRECFIPPKYQLIYRPSYENVVLMRFKAVEGGRSN